MRVALVTPGYPPAIGGIEKHVSRLAEGLATIGHNVDVLTHRSDRSSPAVAAHEGITLRRFGLTIGSPTYPVSLPLFSYLRQARDDYDIVHVHNFHSSVSAAGLVVGRHTPVVFTPHFHGSGHTRFARWLHVTYRPIARAAISKAAQIICVTEAEATALAGRFGHARGKIVVVRNGVDRPPTALPFDKTGPVILTVARLEPHKHVERVVEAMREIPEPFRLVVVGDGSCRPALEQLADRLNVRDRVIFAGRIEQGELDRWMATASVLVTMSTEEAFGLTILEAAAAGVPVIASDVPAHRDVAGLARDRVMLLDPVTKAPRLAGAILQAEAVPRWDAAHREDLARNASWQQTAISTVAVYRSALGQA